MKKKIISILLTLILISIIFSGCINDGEEDRNAIFEYSLKINFPSASLINYTIICPLFIWENGTPSDINNHFTILSGSCEYNITQTSKGWGLAISTSNSIEIELKYEMSSKKYSKNLQYLSLCDNFTKVKWGNEYFIFYDGESNNTTISLNAIIRDRIPHTNGVTHLQIESRLYNGWHKYNAILEMDAD